MTKPLQFWEIFVRDVDFPVAAFPGSDCGPSS